MKLGANFIESFNYTKLLFKDLKQLIMLMILSVIPVVNFVFLGYLGNIMKQSKDAKELPKIDNYVELGIQGLKMGIVSIVYMIIPLCIIMSGYDIFGIFSFIDLRGTVAIMAMLVGVLIMLVVSIILAMALVKMVKHDNNINEAWAFGDIMEHVKKVGWITCIVGVIAIALTTGIISYILYALAAKIGDGVMFSISGTVIIALLLLPSFGTFTARSATLTYLEGAPAQETATPTEQT